MPSAWFVRFTRLARLPRVARVARFADPGARRIKVLKGLVYASLSLPGRARPLRRALKGLEAEIGGQVLGDSRRAAGGAWGGE